MSSNTSTTSDVVPFRIKLSLSKRNDELALETQSMLPLDVQTPTTTFHKYWMDRWKTFVKSSDLADIFATVVSQMERTIRIKIETEVFYKNLQKKNKEFLIYLLGQGSGQES